MWHKVPLCTAKGIEIKKVAEGQVALGMEAKEETPDEVLMCAARGFVGVARNLLGPMATNPQFAEEISRGIKGMLLDTEDLKVTRGVEGKEAKFIAALYGMNGCCRGSSAAGISVYIKVNLSAFPSAFGRARTQLPYRGEPFSNEASGRALWGASIPVIPVTVMGHRKENYTTSSRQQEGTG